LQNNVHSALREMRVLTNPRRGIDGKIDRFAIVKGTLHAAFEGRMERHPRFEPVGV
jgi:hypothetical protein